MLETIKSNPETFVDMMVDCMTEGHAIYPRGQEVLELQDYSFSIDPTFPFMTFGERKYSLDYFKAEMLWKLSANKYDETIKQHAKMWESVQNPDGTFNSNYGQYWFGEQHGFWSVVEELARDKDSRQAVIPMLSKDHMSAQTIDKVCTMGVGFRIRNNKLHMSAYMRSSDQIFGLGTDLPTFSFLYRMVLGALRPTYPELEIGRLNVTAMSSHIYSRHYPMVNKIILAGPTDYVQTPMPFASGMAEVLFIIAKRGKYTTAPAEYHLAHWLIRESGDAAI